MIIGVKTIAAITETIGGLLKDYQEEMDKTYRSQDDPLRVNLGVVLKPGSSGTTAICSIGFSRAKTKDKVEVTVDEDQHEMFGGE